MWSRGLVVALAVFSTSVMAQDSDPSPVPYHHPLHHDFYKQWKQPNSHESCCNARVVRADGYEIGDCEPTKAEIRDGQWWAWYRDVEPSLSKWVPIPDNRIIRERNPEQGGPNGHLCYSYGKVLCFVPPDTGG